MEKETLKESLKQYIHLCKEFEKEELRIKKMQQDLDAMVPDNKVVTDVVTKGKRGKKPLGICTIRGIDDNTIRRRRTKLRERKAKQELMLSTLENMIIDAEEYINEVPDSETRQMMRHFFIDGQEWTEVAESMGDGYTADACKKRVQRELAKK